MSQWEYRKLLLNETPRKTDDIDLLNDAGKDGWELIAITTNSVAYLRRSIDTAVRAAQQPMTRTTRKAAPARMVGG